MQNEELADLYGDNEIIEMAQEYDEQQEGVVFDTIKEIGLIYTL